MSQDLITIEVDGKSLKAKKGEMLIRVTDAAGITVPRFCYHKKLSVAANCRMCLVEIEKAPKPLPACATPVMDGMKVHTKSARALDAQKGVMEFLLINHPLDCPICDQGGECELQDVAMGYGSDVSRYTEAKRVVKDKDIGPLVSTDMTRCIHCTRCVRFGEEVAGLRELGATGRGENMRIGTYIEKAMTSELSGNIIDLCPVGALNAKPSRFSGRSWEMVQHSTVAPHDCVGSNLYMHTLRGQIKRVVPKENEAINETWLSDRDRFSYEGVLSADRLAAPMIKHKGLWKKASWEDALDAVKLGIADQIKANGADSLGSLVSPTATLEELFLLQQLTRGLGSNSIDHRLCQQDFSDQDHAPVMPWLGSDLAALENIDVALLIASNIRKDQPMAAHRIRKAAMKGAQVSFVNSRAYDFHFPVAAQQIASAYELHNELAAIASLLYKAKKEKPSAAIAALLEGVEVTAAHQLIAQSLIKAKRGVVILGSQAHLSPQLSALRLLSNAIARHSGCTFGYLPEAGNTAGAWLTGCVPHRGVAGAASKKAGYNANQMLEKALSAYVLFNVEPESDCANPELAIDSLQQASFVVACTPYITEAMKSYAHVLLPIATFAETSGTYVNAEGQWQTVKAVAQAAGETRPGWKVLRVLGNLFGLENFEQLSSDDVRLAVQALCQNVQLSNDLKDDYAVKSVATPKGLLRLSDVALYSGDSVLRRAKSLQNTTDAKAATKAYISDATSKKQKLSGVTRVNVVQGGKSIVMDLVGDNGVPDNCVWVATGTAASEQLGAAFGAVKLEAI